MWFIKHKETGEYFYDYVCGCFVWKRHPQRAIDFLTAEDAQQTIGDLEMQEFTCLVFEE